MKTRQGFVSNSSSSSFIVFGVQVDSREDVFRTGAKNDPAWALKLIKDAGSYEAEILEELDLTELNETNIISDEVLDYIVDTGSDWDLFYDLQLHGYELHTGDDSSDGAIAGICIGSVDYGIGELASIKELEKLIKNDAPALKAAFGEEPALHYVYTGY